MVVVEAARRCRQTHRGLAEMTEEKRGGVHPEEFDLTATVRKLLAENRLTAEDALTAILEGLMDQHKAARDAHRGGPEPVTYLQGLEVVLSLESNKNLDT